jgi:tyrosine-protein phosphatase SIW14
VAAVEAETFTFRRHHKIRQLDFMKKHERQLTAFTVVIFALATTPSLQAGSVFEAPGVPNFHQVDDHVFRGGQPSAQGFESLSLIGVKTVIDLRSGAERLRGEESLVNAAGMHYIDVPLNGFTAPTDQQIATLLSLLDDSSGWPVFIHCRRGADRTGTVIACYRVAHDHWANEKALTEAKLYRMSRREQKMRHYVLDFTPPQAQTSHPLIPVGH